MNLRQMTLAILIFFSIGNQFADAQIRKSEMADKNLTLPKPEEIAGIEIGKTSAIEWYKPEELLKLLPEFVAGEGTYLDKQPFQRGTFVLKTGKKITWLANGKDSILLYEGSNEQLFVLPKKNKALFPIFDKDGKEGFIDVNGRIVITPQFDKVMEFSEGLALVLIGDKWGYINEKGEIVIAPRWKPQSDFSLNGSRFHEGLAAVVESVERYGSDDYDYQLYECGYINPKGEYVIKPKFRLSCGIFSEGLAKIEVAPKGGEYNKSGGRIGFIDKLGNWAIKPQFISASDFSGGFASAMSLDVPQAMLERSFFLIDKTGRKITDKKDCKWRYGFSEGLAFIYPDRFINEQCEDVFKLPSGIETNGYASYISEGLANVSKEINGEQRFGYLDRTGKVAIDFIFTKSSAFSDGLAYVNLKENGKDFNAYINRKGEIILKNIRSTGDFKNGLAYNWLYTFTISERPSSRNIRGYMNKQGKYVWLSPRAENYLDKTWIEENYVGLQVFDKKR